MNLKNKIYIYSKQSISSEALDLFKERSTTIPKGSTPKAIVGGSGEHLEKDDDIV